jgi:hypothetical protein
MPLTAKILVVLFCFALCAVGAFIAPCVSEQSNQPQRTNAIPVKNHEIAPRVWIVATRL